MMLLMVTASLDQLMISAMRDQVASVVIPMKTELIESPKMFACPTHLKIVSRVVQKKCVEVTLSNNLKIVAIEIL